MLRDNRTATNECVLYGREEYVNITFEKLASPTRAVPYIIKCSRHILDLYLNLEQWCITTQDTVGVGGANISNTAIVPIPSNIDAEYVDILIGNMYGNKMILDQINKLDLSRVMDAADWMMMTTPIPVFTKPAEVVMSNVSMDQIIYHKDFVMRYTSNAQIMSQIIATGPASLPFFKLLGEKETYWIMVHQNVSRDILRNYIDPDSTGRESASRIYITLTIRGELQFMPLLCRKTLLRTGLGDWLIDMLLHTSNDDIIVFENRLLYTRMSDAFGRVIRYEVSDRNPVFGESTHSLDDGRIHVKCDFVYDCRTLSDKPISVSFLKPRVEHQKRISQLKLTYK